MTRDRVSQLFTYIVLIAKHVVGLRTCWTQIGLQSEPYSDSSYCRGHLRLATSPSVVISPCGCLSVVVVLLLWQTYGGV